MMRIVYFYLMKDDPDRVRAIAPDHATYWRDLDPPGYVGGPTADRRAGLITFEAGSVEEAESLVDNDPFVRANLINGAWVKEWIPSGARTTERDLRTAGSGSPGR
jgi:uncharacterized protein YciI